MASSIQAPYENFFGLDGLPLTAGYIYIGVAGLDPVTNPVPVYWDAALTIPASQPLRTNAGYIVRAGSPARVYVASNYSITVNDINNVTVYYVPNYGIVDYQGSLGSTLIGNGAETVAQSFDALQLDDYAALRAYSAARKSVYITGYRASAAKLGISGMFIRDDNDTTTADNGGTVIVCTNGKRYKRAFSGPVFANWFGARGDGVTDDYAAWNAAKTFIYSQPNGGTLTATPGNYLFSARLDFPTVANKAVIIDGYGVVIARFGTYLGSLIYAGTPSGGIAAPPIIINGIWFAGPYVTPIVSTALFLEHANGATVRDCQFSSGTSGITLTETYAAKILQCKFNFSTSYGITSTTMCHNLQVIGCQFANIGAPQSGGTFTTGCDLYIVGLAFNISILSNDFEGGTAAFVAVAGGSAVTFQGNYVEGKAQLPIFFGAAAKGTQIFGNWIGYNFAAQVWSNIKGGEFSNNTVYNQVMSADASCENFDIGTNGFEGTSLPFYRPWTVPTLGGGFSNAGAPYQVASYTKDATGRVTLRGVVISATDGNIFTLPVGMRPSANQIFPLVGVNRLAASAIVNATGVVTIYRATDNSADMGNISFIAGN